MHTTSKPIGVPNSKKTIRFTIEEIKTIRQILWNNALWRHNHYKARGYGITRYVTEIELAEIFNVTQPEISYIRHWRVHKHIHLTRMEVPIEINFTTKQLSGIRFYLPEVSSNE